MSTYTVSQLANDAGVSVHVVRAAFEAGIGLDASARLCRALDAVNGTQAAAQRLAALRQLVERRREALADLDAQLAVMPTERACEETLP